LLYGVDFASAASSERLVPGRHTARPVVRGQRRLQMRPDMRVVVRFVLVALRLLGLLERR
jgi:hypothetical protein